MSHDPTGGAGDEPVHLTRRALLRGAGLGAGTVLLAGCASAAAPTWTFGPPWRPGASSASGSPSASGLEAAASAAPAVSPPPPTASAAPSAAPARTVTVDEISRHPSELPDSADYELYADGRYQQLAKRVGPMTHTVRFTTREVIAEVVSGTTMEYWTFDGHVPGPMIRARVGDRIDFFLKNDPASTMPHDVDFHAVTGPGGGAVKLDTLPGHESELRVKLLNPGIFIYHCAFPDVPTHIAHGMYGLIVVEPEGGLPPVDHEYYVLQSEFYTDGGSTRAYAALKGAGHLSFSMDNANDERPTFVVLNGRPESCVGPRALGTFDRPIKVGEKVRMFVGNIGPNLISSFHVIGEIFDTVYVEGSFALENHSVQSTAIPCGGAAGVEFQVQVPGTYTMLDHAIFRVHKGVAGEMVVSGDPVPEVFDPVTSDSLRG
jgi:nitrite reductase (NO-forming)